MDSSIYPCTRFFGRGTGTFFYDAVLLHPCMPCSMQAGTRSLPRKVPHRTRRTRQPIGHVILARVHLTSNFSALSSVGRFLQSGWPAQCECRAMAVYYNFLHCLIRLPTTHQSANRISALVANLAYPSCRRLCPYLQFLLFYLWTRTSLCLWLQRRRPQHQWLLVLSNFLSNTIRQVRPYERGSRDEL